MFIVKKTPLHVRWCVVQRHRIHCIIHAVVLTFNLFPRDCILLSGIACDFASEDPQCGAFKFAIVVGLFQAVDNQFFWQISHILSPDQVM